MITCSKKFLDIAFAHRAPFHEGHCSLIHGHNWSFDITFEGERDRNGFIFDFGKLRDLRATFTELFDHKLLLNEDDPLKEDICKFLDAHKLSNVTLVKDCSCEGIAELVFNLASVFVRNETKGRVEIVRVTVCESSTNMATYAG